MTIDIEQLATRLIGLGTEYGLSLIGAVAILIAGLWLAGKVQRAVERALGRLRKIDETLSRFFASLARYTVLIFTVLAVLGQFGIQTASLVAILGAAGLAIGLALQGTLANLAAGVMLLIFRPFKVGHFIEAGGIAGTVQALTLFVTEINRPDNVRIIVPNGKLWGTAISNFSENDRRRLDLTIGIGYDDDIDKALATLDAILAADTRVDRDPTPLVAVSGLGDNSVDLLVRVWCGRGDFYTLKRDLLKTIKQTFDSEGISFPYPQRDVHLIK